MIIQHNISAINSHRQLGINNANTSKNLEKLSSGYRINRAGDDAAGLAISEKMRGQIRGLSMAEQNVSHGINLIQTAEGGLQETHAILQRMRELAVQSANGTYDDENDRFNLNKEVTALKAEIDRIAESTHYNNIKLLNGNLSTDLRMNQATLDNTDGIMGSVSINQTVATANSNIDGTLRVETEVDTKASLEIDLEDLLDKVVAAVGLTTTDVDVTIAGVTVNLTGLTSGATLRSTVMAQIAADVTAGLTNHTATATGDKLKIELTGVPTTNEDSVLKAFDGTGITATDVTGGGSVNIAATGALSYTDGTSKIKEIEWSNDGGTTYTSILAQVDTDGNYFVTENGITVTFDIDQLRADADVAIGTAVTGDLEFGLAAGQGLTLQIGANGNADEQLSFTVANTASAAIGSWARNADHTYDLSQGLATVANSTNNRSIGGITVADQTLANAAIKVIDDAINYVSSIRADLGAIQNRLEHTMNNLGVTKENLTAAESTIRDVDMAKEMMEYTKNSILVQASQAMLAQAQSLPQGVLNLLR